MSLVESTTAFDDCRRAKRLSGKGREAIRLAVGAMAFLGVAAMVATCGRGSRSSVVILHPFLEKWTACRLNSQRKASLGKPSKYVRRIVALQIGQPIIPPPSPRVKYKRIFTPNSPRNASPLLSPLGGHPMRSQCRNTHPAALFQPSHSLAATAKARTRSICNGAQAPGRRPCSPGTRGE